MIISHYFYRQLFGIFFMLLFILTGLAWMMQVISMLKFLINYGISISGFVGLTLLMIPFIASIILPFITFIALLFIYNKLIADNEITILAANGFSPAKIARPGLIFASIIMVIHFIFNLYIVPNTQAKFYDTQWQMRYGLAHLKIQESAFTEITSGLVVYVESVSGTDLSQIMLSDTRDEKSDMAIMAETGKIVSNGSGLSIVMTNGSLGVSGENSAVGTFKSFDMDMNISDTSNGDAAFRVRRTPTLELFKLVNSEDVKVKDKKLIWVEIGNRIFAPIMNICLALMVMIVLLRSSLLRRRTSFAPIISVATMAGMMALFMTCVNLIGGIWTLFTFGICLFIIIIILSGWLYKK